MNQFIQKITASIFFMLLVLFGLVSCGETWEALDILSLNDARMYGRVQLLVEDRHGPSDAFNVASDSTLFDLNAILNITFLDEEESRVNKATMTALQYNLISPSDCTFLFLNELDVFLDNGTQRVQIAHLDSLPEPPGRELILSVVQSDELRDVLFNNRGNMEREGVKLITRMSINDSLRSDLVTEIRASYDMSGE